MQLLSYDRAQEKKLSKVSKRKCARGAKQRRWCNDGHHLIWCCLMIGCSSSSMVIRRERDQCLDQITSTAVSLFHGIRRRMMIPISHGVREMIVFLRFCCDCPFPWYSEKDGVLISHGVREMIVITLLLAHKKDEVWLLHGFRRKRCLPFLRCLGKKDMCWAEGAWINTNHHSLQPQTSVLLRGSFGVVILWVRNL